MTAGRKKKPNALRALEGDHHKSRYNKSEPQPDCLRDSTPPEWLNDEAMRLWYRLAPPLLNLGLLTEIDAVAFEALCETYQAFRDSPHDSKRVARLQSLLAEFGCTPSSRSRITGATNQEAADPMERLLAGGL